MNYQEYVAWFEEIISGRFNGAPYDNPDYLEYTKLNYQRMKRWEKTLVLDEELVQLLQDLKAPQQWIVIVEPWCGDVAPSLPFLVKLAEISPFVRYELQLRDSEPFLINAYLTRGTKSIPKLVVRGADGADIFTWGARPAAAQQLMDALKAGEADLNKIRTQLQNWYNEDKGRSLQAELLSNFRHHLVK